MKKIDINATLNIVCPYCKVGIGEYCKTNKGKTTLQWHSSRVKLEGKILRAQIESLQTKGYKEVIQVNVPIRFYWNPDGTFDGIEIGEFNEDLTAWEQDMLDQVLNAMKPAMGIPKSEVEDEYDGTMS